MAPKVNNSPTRGVGPYVSPDVPYEHADDLENDHPMKSARGSSLLSLVEDDAGETGPAAGGRRPPIRVKRGQVATVLSHAETRRHHLALEKNSAISTKRSAAAEARMAMSAQIDAQLKLSKAATERGDEAAARGSLAMILRQAQEKAGVEVWPEWYTRDVPSSVLQAEVSRYSNLFAAGERADAAADKEGRLSARGDRVSRSNEQRRIDMLRQQAVRLAEVAASFRRDADGKIREMDSRGEWKETTPERWALASKAKREAEQALRSAEAEFVKLHGPSARAGGGEDPVDDWLGDEDLDEEDLDDEEG